MADLFQWMQALLLAEKFCCAVKMKSSHVLAQPSAAAEPRVAIATPRLADMSACPSRTAPEGPTCIAISRDPHRKTENINTSHLFALIKGKEFLSKLSRPRKKGKSWNTDGESVSHSVVSNSLQPHGL